jgi:hypothetical protein
MNRIIIILLTFAGCQHSPSSSDLAQGGQCDAAFDAIAWETSQIKVAETSKQVVGSAASYTATGLGYLTDAFVFVGEGAFKSIVYCPYATVALGAAIATQARMPHLVFCGKGSIKVEGSDFGEKIYYHTSNFRKTDFDKISEINRDVASCYAKKGGDENKRIARDKLEPLAENEDFLKNLSGEEHARLLAAYNLYVQ